MAVGAAIVALFVLTRIGRALVAILAGAAFILTALVDALATRWRPRLVRRREHRRRIREIRRDLRRIDS
ncbi:MAG TPA: hypothetical protein VKV34_08860 [Thermoleophilia bacterium]|nr:hypothetical protein [Thermoleophilia bacterium]